MGLRDALKPKDGPSCRFDFLRCATGIHVREKVHRPWGWSIFCWLCGKKLREYRVEGGKPRRVPRRHWRRTV